MKPLQKPFWRDFLGWGATDNLGNGGAISSPLAGAVIDEVNYNDTSPGTAADGSGAFLELIDAALDNNDGANWVATTATRFGNTNVFATPGHD